MLKLEIREQPCIASCKFPCFKCANDCSYKSYFKFNGNGRKMVFDGRNCSFLRYYLKDECGLNNKHTHIMIEQNSCLVLSNDVGKSSSHKKLTFVMYSLLSMPANVTCALRTHSLLHDIIQVRWLFEATIEVSFARNEAS